MNDEDLKKLEQNAFKNTMKDGITETLAGLLFLFMAIMYTNPSFVAIFVIFYIILFPQLIEQYRQRETYPRIGYVKLKTSESDFQFAPLALLLAAIVFLTAIATYLLTDDLFDIYNWLIFIPFVVGLIMLAPSDYLVEKTGSKIYWLFGGFTSILGFAVSYLSVLYSINDYISGMVIFSSILSPILVFGGLFKIIYFKRKYPIIEQQEDVVSDQ